MPYKFILERKEYTTLAVDTGTKTMVKDYAKFHKITSAAATYKLIRAGIMADREYSAVLHKALKDGTVIP